MKPSRMSKFYTGIYASLKAYLLSVQRPTLAMINQSCSCSELKQDTGFVLAVDSASRPTLCSRLQMWGCSHHLMSQCAWRTFLHFIWGEIIACWALSRKSVSEVCVADACLFGFHVSMATGTYLPCAVSTVFHTVHYMCHYCILHTFLQSKEQRV